MEANQITHRESPETNPTPKKKKTTSRLYLMGTPAYFRRLRRLGQCFMLAGWVGKFHSYLLLVVWLGSWFGRMVKGMADLPVIVS